MSDTASDIIKDLRAIADFHRPTSEWAGALSDDDIALMYAIAARLAQPEHHGTGDVLRGQAGQHYD